MKGLILAVLMVTGSAFLNGCCTDDLCNLSGSTYVPASVDNKQCNNCSTCSSCGYDKSYTYSGWY